MLMLMMSRTQRAPGRYCSSLKNMARLGVEPRLPEYIPGALPTELPSLGPGEINGMASLLSL